MAKTLRKRDLAPDHVSRLVMGIARDSYEYEPVDPVYDLSARELKLVR